VQIRTDLAIADKEEGSTDRTCPVVLEYFGSGRGDGYVTVFCK
jgi:hypothetical protein